MNIAQLKALKTWVEEEGGTWQLSVNGQNATKVNKDSNLNLVAGSNNIKIVKNDDKIIFDLNKELALTAVWTRNVRLTDNGLFIVNGPSVTTVGINASNIKVINVADGNLFNGSKDAVNAGQVYELNSTIATYLGGNANVLENRAPTYTIQSQEYNNVGDTFTGVDTSLTRLSKKINDVADSILVEQNLRTRRITIGTKTDGAEIEITNREGESRILSGVKDGDLSTHSTEAVNRAQLYKVDESVKTLGGTILKIEGKVTNLDTNVTKLNTNISEYLGGGANMLIDKAPTYTIQSHEYGNVGAAFVGIDESLTQLSSRIDNVVSNNLVQQEQGTHKITICAKVEGSEISINNKRGGARKLTGLADGQVSEGSTDAVNGAQLYKLSGNVSQYLGGGANILEDTAPTYIIQKQTYNDVGAAFAASLTKLQNNINTNTAAVKENALFWSDKEGAFVVLHVNKGEERGTAENNKLKFLLDGDVSKDSTEAITGNQLYELNNQLAAYLGGGAGYQDGQWIDPTFTITDFGGQSKNGKQAYNNVADAFEAVNSSMSGLSNRIDHVEHQVGSQVNSDGLNWNAGKNAYDASHNGQVGKITNVKDGVIAAGSTDAITGNQLWAAYEKVNHLEDEISSIAGEVGTLTEGVVTYDKDEQGKKTNTITLVGGKEDEPVVIDNVAGGKIEEGSKQAVNGGQLHNYVQEQMSLVLADANKYTDEKIENMVGDAVVQANTYTDMKFDALNYKIDSVQKEARQAAAIGLAVSNLRYNDTPGKFSVAFGSGVWRGQSAPAFGAGYTSEDGDIRSNLSVTTSGGHWGVGAGLSFTVN